MISIPGLCWLCHMPLAIPAWGICSRCSQQLPRLPPCCWQCGLPVSRPDIPCGRCLRKPPPWQHLIALSDYLPPLSTLIHNLKFHQNTALSIALARLLLLQIREARRQRQLPVPDLLISVPLHKLRQWQRGYNQSALLAQWLAQKLDITCPAGAIQRIRHTPSQHQLDARQRRRNLKQAFTLTIPVSGLHIALLDDIVTTGSTVAEISRLLMRTGAVSVQIWCLCRTL